MKQPKSKMGLYVHIPFCQHACHYCDFSFSTLTKYIEPWIDALILEMGTYKSLLSKYSIHTLYFGGGTPSLLNQKQWTKIFDRLHSHYNLENIQEQTIEVNPENLSTTNLKWWQSLGFNRLSVGVQSFNDVALKWMNRHHTSTQSLNGIARARECGFSNISADFIFNIPIKDTYEGDLLTFLSLKLPHLSCYSLTIEEKTVFGYRNKRKQLKILHEDAATKETEKLWTSLQQHGYNQYEVSNFCLPGYESVHNSNYWKHISYVGLGSSAHSYIQGKRWSNINSNGRYMHTLKRGVSPIAESEVLSARDIFNEKIMFGLRTNMGISLNDIEKIIPSYDKESFFGTVSKWKETGHLIMDENVIIPTQKGKLIANTIAQDLFINSKNGDNND